MVCDNCTSANNNMLWKVDLKMGRTEINYLCDRCMRKFVRSGALQSGFLCSLYHIKPKGGFD